MKLGLRIDVDTLRGTRDGVPALCAMLERHAVRASFFFSVGPDNMGRHLWRLFRPAFLAKMLRTGAPGLYGWDILLRGTFWPGPVIGREAASAIRLAADRGHEIGLHAWDHHAWQSGLERMTEARLTQDFERGLALLREAAGRPATCSAAPAWKCTEDVLRVKTLRGFRYNSDCRGRSVFLPLMESRPVQPPQVPCTLPTYDEVIGRYGVTDATYNAFVFSQLRPDALNVLSIHAEVEGIGRADLFATFLDAAARRGVTPVPLGDCLADWPQPQPARMVRGAVEGREGWLSIQGEGTGT
jgi:undecaprenyl phosphate-alpha-L-ara4FN deformylase